MRMFKFWLHNELIYRQTKTYQRECHAIANCGIRYAPAIVKNVRDKMVEDGPVEGKQKTFMRALLDAKNNLTDAEVYDEIGSVIVAAQDTSAVTSSATLLLLAMHKDVQDRIVKELVEVLGTTDKNAFIDFDQVNKLEYLEMVINEAMRVLPTVPVYFRAVDEEITTSEGYVIPAKAVLMIPVYTVHKSKLYWGEDADEFKPERFEKENFSKMHPYAFMPFGKGLRMCIGWRYALFLLKIQVATFLMRYEVNTTLKLNELEFKVSMALNVTQGYMISIKERKF